MSSMSRTHRSPTGIALRLGALVTLLAHGGLAQTNSLDQVYAEGFSILRLEPAPAGDRFFAVPDGTTSDADERFRAMLFLHETLSAPIVRTDNDTGETREIVSNQFFVHLDGTFVAAEWFDANVDVPIALVQQGEGPAAPDSPAVGDVRLSSRARLVGSEHAAFSFAGALDLWIPTGSEANLTGDGSLRAQPKALASGRAGAFVYASSLGLVLREHTDAGAAEVGTSLGYGAAVGLSLIDDRLTFGPELYGSALLVSERDAAFARASSPLEALFGVRGRFGPVAVGAGASIGLSDAPGVAPRIVASLAYAPVTPRPAPPPPPPEEPEAVAPAPPPSEPVAPPDSDGDSVADADDACPDEKGAPSTDARMNGCAPKPPSADEDEDGLDGANDSCPREAASLAPGSPTNGCPGTGPAEAVFAGYRQEPGGHATVFVELSDSVKVVLEKTKGGMSFVLPGTRVALRNNQNPLLAMDFASNVRSAQLVPEKDAVRLRIEFRTDVTPSHRIVRRGRGATLEVLIPPN
jgi:hypothetical protein